MPEWSWWFLFQALWHLLIDIQTIVDVFFFLISENWSFWKRIILDHINNKPSFIKINHFYQTEFRKATYIVKHINQTGLYYMLIY